MFDAEKVAAGESEIKKEEIGDEMKCANKLPLPDFSPLVKYALRNGDSVSVWQNLVDQCFNFYSANYLKECDGVAVYQQIGRDIYRKYKSIQREGLYIRLCI